MSERKLTTKQQIFVEAYLGKANANATESARIAGYKGNDVTLGQVGAENLKKPQILDLIEKKVETFGLTAKQVIEGIKEIAENRSERTSDRLKAFELIGKWLELWTEKQKLEGKVRIEIEYV